MNKHRSSTANLVFYASAALSTLKNVKVLLTSAFFLSLFSERGPEIVSGSSLLANSASAYPPKRKTFLRVRMRMER